LRSDELYRDRDIMDIDKKQVLQLCVTSFFIPQHLFSKLYSYAHLRCARENPRARKSTQFWSG